MFLPLSPQYCFLCLYFVYTCVSVATAIANYCVPLENVLQTADSASAWCDYFYTELVYADCLKSYVFCCGCLTLLAFTATVASHCHVATIIMALNTCSSIVTVATLLLTKCCDSSTWATQWMRRLRLSRGDACDAQLQMQRMRRCEKETRACETSPLLNRLKYLPHTCFLRHETHVLSNYCLDVLQCPSTYELVT